jgi:hypothetical protein
LDSDPCAELRQRSSEKGETRFCWIQRKSLKHVLIPLDEIRLEKLFTSRNKGNRTIIQTGFAVVVAANGRINRSLNAGTGNLIWSSKVMSLFWVRDGFNEVGEKNGRSEGELTLRKATV